MKDIFTRRVLFTAETLLCRYWLPFGFFLFLSVLFLAPHSHNYKVIINYALMLPALLACLLVPRWLPTLRQYSGKLFAITLAYLIYMAGNAYLHSALDGFDYVKWSFYIAIFLLAVGCCMQITEHLLGQLLWAAVMIAAMAAAYAIWRDTTSGAIHLPEYRLIGYGPLYNPLRSGHQFGAFLIMAAWCVACAPVRQTQRWLAALAALIVFWAILLTDSRAPLIAVAATALLAILGMATPRYRWHYLVTLGVIASLSLALFGTRLAVRGLSLRPELWQLALTQAAAHPWLGVGLGGQFMATASNGQTYLDTHNVFLALLYYGGAIGLLLFLGMLAVTFRTAWRDRHRLPLCALAASLQLFGIATLQFDGGSQISRPNEFWLLYWLPIALTLYAQRQPLKGKEALGNAA